MTLSCNVFFLFLGEVDGSLLGKIFIFIDTASITQFTSTTSLNYKLIFHCKFCGVFLCFVGATDFLI